MTAMKQTEMEDRLIDIHEVAKRYGVSERTIWREVKRGRIPVPVKPFGATSSVTKWRKSEIDLSIARMAPLK